MTLLLQPSMASLLNTAFSILTLSNTSYLNNLFIIHSHSFLSCYTLYLHNLTFIPSEATALFVTNKYSCALESARNIQSLSLLHDMITHWRYTSLLNTEYTEAVHSVPLLQPQRHSSHTSSTLVPIVHPKVPASPLPFQHPNRNFHLPFHT
ncbi:uncharacterized protein BDV14DRAFT_175841 [Aspergillus stella-maris]|uniref:uncharacterized protein n=1 Tax=Aspergillus stella-maris TaxID=1810926 RepID=UPI003CCCEE1A